MFIILVLVAQTWQIYPLLSSELKGVKIQETLVLKTRVDQDIKNSKKNKIEKDTIYNERSIVFIEASFLRRRWSRYIKKRLC